LSIVQPLQDAIRFVSGDGPALANAAGNFGNIGTGLQDYAQKFVEDAIQSLSQWDGPAAEAAATKLAQFSKGIDGIAGQAGDIAQLLQISSMVMTVIEEFIKALVTEFMTWLIMIWIPARRGRADLRRIHGGGRCRDRDQGRADRREGHGADLTSHRDRALLAFWVSTAARASELLTVTRGGVSPIDQVITVVRKGTRAEQMLPASSSYQVEPALAPRDQGVAQHRPARLRSKRPELRVHEPRARVWGAVVSSNWFTRQQAAETARQDQGLSRQVEDVVHRSQDELQRDHGHEETAEPTGPNGPQRGQRGGRKGRLGDSATRCGRDGRPTDHRGCGTSFAAEAKKAAWDSVGLKKATDRGANRQTPGDAKTWAQTGVDVGKKAYTYGNGANKANAYDETGEEQTKEKTSDNLDF
jgi:hypothetical protein